jgi:RNA polymerase sigma-70 factor (ECF subfamily)
LTRAAEATGIAPRAALAVAEINAEPALLLRIDGQLEGVFVLSTDEGVVRAVRAIRNPEKLAYLSRQLAATVTAT